MVGKPEWIRWSDSLETDPLSPVQQPAVEDGPPGFSPEGGLDHGEEESSEEGRQEDHEEGRQEEVSEGDRCEEVDLVLGAWD
jgi:hypothetical protein